MLSMTRDQVIRHLQAAQRKAAAGDRDGARALYRQVLLVQPTLAEAHAQLARLAFDDGDRTGALDHLKAALDAAPNAAKLWQLAASLYAQLDQTDAALGAHDRLIAIDPKSIKPRADKALYLQRIGRFDQAQAIFRKLLKKVPDEGELWRMALGSEILKPGDPRIAQMRKAWADPTLEDRKRLHLGFALARAMEETGQTPRVFAYLDRANALQKKAAPYDHAAREREVAAVLAAQEGLGAAEGDPALWPVFILGMPRSGTTLVERIVAAHSGAVAGGEMGHAVRLAYQRFGPGEKMTTPDDPTALEAYGTDYLALARRDTGAASGVITDKSIQTPMVLGLLRAAIPGARFVVVHRDPRDIALSIYKNYFELGTHRYANDFGDIAQAIKLFRRMIAHWRGKLPGGTLHDVRYEDLVADPEPQARALVTAAGLDWEDACLDFHKAQGTVKTLSLHQVRQPIHAGRREAWRAYETELQPFFDAWGDEPWD